MSVFGYLSFITWTPSDILKIDQYVWTFSKLILVTKLQPYNLMKFSLLCLGEAAVTVSDDEEIYHIIQEAGVLPHSLRPRVHRRQVARTRMSERIYRQIQEIRRSRFNRRMIILSDSESSDKTEHDLSDEVNKIYCLLSQGCGLSVIRPLN